MAATISEEVKAVFTADTSGLVRGVDDARARLAKLRQESSARSAAGNVKNLILNPQEIVNKGLDKLIGTMKVSALMGGVAAAGFSLAASALQRLGEEASLANQETLALSESVRKLSNANSFTSVAEGSQSLAGRLAALRDQQTALREDSARLNPTDFRAQNKLTAQYAISANTFSDPFGQQALANDRNKNALEQQRVAQETAKITTQISESLRRQRDLSFDRLGFDQQTVQIKELELQKEREINDLRASGGSTPENERLTSERYDAEIHAQEDLRDSLAARARTEVEIRDLKLSSLSVDQQSVAAAEKRVTQIQRELQSRRYINTEEGRQLEAELQENQNTVRLAERSAAMESPGARNRRFYNQQRREARNQRADARVDATDGLINLQRDFSGRITGGTDIVTGLRRPVSPGFAQSSGLQTGSLGPSFVRASFGQNRFNGNSLPGLTSLKDSGHDTDVGHGRTLIAAQNKLIDAADISNAYLKNISDHLDNMGYA